MLSIDLQLLLTTVIIFLCLIFVLNRILYRPILAFIDNRNSSITSDEQTLQKQSDDTKSYKEEAENILAQARVKIGEIKNKAVEEANLIAQKKIAQTKATLEEDYKSFLVVLEQENQKLKSDLLLKMPEFKSTLNSKLSNL